MPFRNQKAKLQTNKKARLQATTVVTEVALAMHDPDTATATGATSSGCAESHSGAVSSEASMANQHNDKKHCEVPGTPPIDSAREKLIAEKYALKRKQEPGILDRARKRRLAKMLPAKEKQDSEIVAHTTISTQGTKNVVKVVTRVEVAASPDTPSPPTPSTPS